MSFKEALEILAAFATIIAAVVAVGGVTLAWQKRLFHNLHTILKHHAAKAKEAQLKDEN